MEQWLPSEIALLISKHAAFGRDKVLLFLILLMKNILVKLQKTPNLKWYAQDQLVQDFVHQPYLILWVESRTRTFVQMLTWLPFWGYTVSTNFPRQVLIIYFQGRSSWGNLKYNLLWLNCLSIKDVVHDKWDLISSAIFMPASATPKNNFEKWLAEKAWEPFLNRTFFYSRESLRYHQDIKFDFCRKNISEWFNYTSILDSAPRNSFLFSSILKW